MTNLPAIRPPDASHLPVLQRQEQRVYELWNKRKASSTRRAYASDWRHFEVWCFTAGASALPALPQTIAAYLAHLTTAETPRGEKYSTATIARRMASIGHFHRESGITDDPTKHAAVIGVMEGISRENAGKPTKAKDAILTKHLKRGLRNEPKTLLEFRNRALLLIGFAGAFRRSELVGIDVEHLRFDDEGRVRITLPKSKTNQSGEPESVWILPAGECCPVRALKEWLRVSEITAGAIFRSMDRHKNVKGRISTNLVAYLCKRFAKKVGLDPEQFSAHSLRSGHVTQALISEVPIALIQQQTRHRDINTLLRYNRDVEPQKRNSSAGLGL